MTKFSKKYFALIMVVISFLMTGCYESAWEQHIGNNNTTTQTLMDVINSNTNLSMFAAVLKKTGYDQVLEIPNSYTVFAPENSAWAGVDTSNVTQLTKMVGMLITYESFYTDNPKLYKSLKSVNGKHIFYDASTKTFNGAKIVTPDLQATNGVIHITDKLVELKDNIWEYISTKTASDQYQFIESMNRQVMDSVKSVATGVYPNGQTKYDTIWKNINSFLEKYPLDNEDSLYTYVVVGNTGFEQLFSKYRPYFAMSTDVQTDSITKFNVCQDFVFKGKVDITSADTLVDVDGVKVPLGGATINETYDASNGRVYFINQSDIRLKDKIKPIIIQGEDYDAAYDAQYVFTRYKRWASGERDIALACQETQTDSLWHVIRDANGVPLKDYTGLNDSIRRDSVASKTYSITDTRFCANAANFWIEYKTNVNSAKYDVYYVAYDDIKDHFDTTYTSFGVYKIIQKLFISMPGAPTLQYGDADNKTEVFNNYLGNKRCFVGEGKAGVHELTKLTQWNLVDQTQILDSPYTGTNADVMVVPKTGQMTLWLCNTARSTTSSHQGLLFLDYILLVPRITAN